MTPLLTIAEAAPLLGRSVHEVRKLVARSRRAARGETVKGATIRFCQDGKGGTIRFRPEWIEEYVDRTTVEPGNEKPRVTRGKSRFDWSDLNLS